MDNTDSLTIDRRRLLVSAAALPAASILPERVVNPSTLLGRSNHCQRHPLFRL